MHKIILNSFHFKRHIEILRLIKIISFNCSSFSDVSRGVPEYVSRAETHRASQCIPGGGYYIGGISMGEPGYDTESLTVDQSG